MKPMHLKIAGGLLALLLAMQPGIAQPPENWHVSPNSYLYSMTITTQLKINGSITDDKDDMIAAFVQDECRGLAHSADSVSASYSNLAFLMVYSNRLEGDTVRFKLYDASEDSVISLANRALFKPNEEYGLPSRPLVNVAEKKKVIAYNFFTPNGDGFNDEWRLKNPDIYIDYELFIYDNKGQRVFHTKELYRNNWDGTHNGNKLPEGVYYYLLKDANGNAAYKGTISLAR